MGKGIIKHCQHIGKLRLVAHPASNISGEKTSIAAGTYSILAVNLLLTSNASREVARGEGEEENGKGSEKGAEMGGPEIVQQKQMQNQNEDNTGAVDIKKRKTKNMYSTREIPRGLSDNNAGKPVQAMRRTMCEGGKGQGACHILKLGLTTFTSKSLSLIFGNGGKIFH